MYFEMPSDALSVAVTTGVGVSLLAGVLSGICYILAQGLGRRRSHPVSRPWHCSVCNGQFRSIHGVLEVEKVATCAKCNQKVCRTRCSRRDPLKGWICQVCQQPEAWFKVILNAIHPSKGSIFSNMDQEAMDELDEDLMELRKKEREQVRDFIERLVESLLGGTLDEVNVGRLYNDRKYLPITGQSPCTAHATLKHLIQRFSSEATELPELKRIQDHPALPEEQATDRTYEDLLSTAIINKVVQSNQDVARSNTNSLSGRASRRTFLGNNNKEYFFAGETLEEKWGNFERNQADDTSSVSSLDEWVRSDSSVGSAKYVDKISLTIKQCIDEDNLTGCEVSDVESNPQDESLDADDTWSENWFLQKRLASSSSPVPVPMLVPNPIEDAKVYIGDKEAGELSDIESDYGEAEVVPDIKHILVNSRTIIGGKNVIENVKVLSDIADEATTEKIVEEENPTVKEVSETEENHLEIDESTFQVAQIPNDEIQYVSLLSNDSHTEKDTEYTEQYASLPRTIVKEPKATPRIYKPQAEPTVDPQPKMNGYQKTESNKIVQNHIENGWHKSQLNGNSTLEELDAFEGSYSKKEKEKWKHAVDMPHNPYSAENLERRLSSMSSSSSTTSSAFGRDYYIRQASRSAGCTKNDYSPPTDSEIFVYNEENTLVTAVPALVNPEEDEPNDYPSMSESSATLTSSRPSQLDVSSDSDMSIERIYNPQTGMMTQNARGVIQEFSVSNSQSPEGIKYVKREFDADMATPIDENRNKTVEMQKHQFLRSLTAESVENDQYTSFMDDIETVSNHEVPYIAETPSFHENTSNCENISQPGSPSEVTSNLQKTLSKFDDITNEFTTDTVIENNQSKVSLDINIVKEFEYALKTKDITNYQIPGKYFGDVKDLVDDKTAATPPDYMEDENSECKEFSLEYSTDVADDISRPESATETDPEILDLKEKKLVKDLLGRYSKSFPNVASIPKKKLEEVQIRKQVSIEYVDECVFNEVHHSQKYEDQVITTNGYEETDEFNHIPSVQNLKKLFDNQQPLDDMKKDSMQLYSLTARSLPKSFREKLKSDEDLSIKPVEEPESTSEDGEDLLPADITKNRIKFFEELQKNKH